MIVEARWIKHVQPANNPVLRFPGSIAGSRDATEGTIEKRLLAEIAGGCQQALAALYRRRGAFIYSLLVQILANETEAREAMQDTFVQIWRRAPKYVPQKSPPLAWIIMVARGVALDRLRARQRRTARHELYRREIASLGIQEIDGLRQTEQGELETACAAALQRLPEPQRRALQLAFLRGWTHEEIARAEGEALGTVKARIRRGLMAMRQILKDYNA
ncbi:MAG: sigma-70 family RNA polymerase sigma factor [Verrucomicrobia subdivision 3 bacterium]|nr:sigma-70 family RNA polymerase sigma factor [Limisphaerales bacterium]